jgi:hypothetical protein
VVRHHGVDHAGPQSLHQRLAVLLTA